MNEYSTPHEAAEEKVRMAANYSFKAEEMKHLQLHRAKNWVAVRAKCKSDKQADQAWNQTESGLREIELSWEMKALDKMISAASSYLRNAENEYRQTPR